MLLSTAPILLFLSVALSSPLSRYRFKYETLEKAPLPLVVWHGLGDDYSRDGMKQIAQLADDANPGTYVHLIRLGESPTKDREASFFGNVTLQIDEVCRQIASDQILSTAPAINALGFSQGGQFLRAYVERCNNPPVHNLVTFGSQHNGIAKFQSCSKTGDWLCWGAEALLRFGRWSATVQSRFVPAQYFRDPEEMDQYLEHSNFLADINNEREVKNETYKQNLMKLNKFVMFMFGEDRTVVPKESAFFTEVNGTTGEQTLLKDREMYKQDWLGLKALDERGALEYRTTPGRHMELDGDVIKDTLKTYFGPVEVDVSGDDNLLMVQPGS